jgi:hypothetical protein
MTTTLKNTLILRILRLAPVLTVDKNKRRHLSNNTDAILSGSVTYFQDKPMRLK